jgi:hypothetical protein
MVVELFDREDERTTVLRSVGNCAPYHTASCPRRPEPPTKPMYCTNLNYRQSEQSPLWANLLQTCNSVCPDFVQKLSLLWDTAICFYTILWCRFLYRIYANTFHSWNTSTSFSGCYTYPFTVLLSISFSRPAILFTQMPILTTLTCSRNLVGFT